MCIRDSFKRLGVSDINDYIRLHNPDPSLPPLSHIVIIIDEFAELKEEMPEFIEELISVSRIGRSMGIHLILATQKPSASVSGEIWSNARFHICLRVQTREDSMEMLHRPDAAFIKGMGSGFAQVGNDEIFEQIQTSYSGAAYDPDALPQGERPHLLDERGAFAPVSYTHLDVYKRQLMCSVHCPTVSPRRDRAVGFVASAAHSPRAAKSVDAGNLFFNYNEKQDNSKPFMTRCKPLMPIR